jgi:hypothetical protein
MRIVSALACVSPRAAATATTGSSIHWRLMASSPRGCFNGELQTQPEASNQARPTGKDLIDQVGLMETIRSAANRAATPAAHLHGGL